MRLDEVNQTTGVDELAVDLSASLAPGQVYSSPLYDNDSAPLATTYTVTLTVTDASTKLVVAEQSVVVSTPAQPSPTPVRL
jgi:hypothetical protein